MQAKNKLHEDYQDEQDADRGNVENIFSQAEIDNTRGVDDDLHAGLSSGSMPQDVEGVCLEICSGAQKGATLFISTDKRYSIGSDFSSDIVLFDESIEAKHIDVELADGQVKLTNIIGACAVDGLAVVLGEGSSKGEVLHDPEFQLQIGTVELYIGSQSSARKVKKEGVESQAPKGEVEDVDQPISVWKNNTLVYLLAAVIAFMLFFYTVFAGNTIDKGFSKDELLEKIAEQLENYSIRNKTIAMLGGNNISVGGYAANTDDYEIISSMLKDHGHTVLNNMSSVEKISASVESLLNSFDLRKGIQAIFDDSGKLVFSGVVYDKERWLTFSEALSQDVSYVNNVDDSGVLTIDEYVETMLPVLTSYELPSKLSVVRVGEEIMVRGEVVPEALESLEEELGILRSELGGYPVISTQIKEAENPLADIVIKLLSNTSMPYIILDSGQKYHSGDELENGYVVEHIGDEKVVFEKSGTKLEVSI